MTQLHILFLWLRSADFAVGRVAARVNIGGHDLPAEIVRRRYDKGLCNLFGLHLPLATSWQFLDNSEATSPRLIAAEAGVAVTTERDMPTWRALKEAYHA